MENAGLAAERWNTTAGLLTLLLPRIERAAKRLVDAMRTGSSTTQAESRLQRLMLMQQACRYWQPAGIEAARTFLLLHDHE